METDARQPPRNGSATAPRELKGIFSIVDGASGSRKMLEDRVRSGFGTHFGACIAGFMRQLTAYRHASGATGVIGIRSAADESLYLENYLEEPVERIISRLAGCPVGRCRIVEVGQFVVDDREIVVDFFLDLVPFLRSLGFDWICFTGTDRIRAILARMGLQGYPVAPATAERVNHLGDRWGTYYDNDPVVTIGSLSDPAGRWLEGHADALRPARQRAG
jgi:hypothetical protein